MTSRPDSTMFAALYGELTVRPWRNGFVASSTDPYSLFVARSSAMGWLAEPAETSTGGVWGMNDAGQDRGLGSSERSRAVWFQVSLIEPVPARRPLPVQAFLSCADDVVARIGTLRLHAVQVLLPVHSLDALAHPSSRVNAVMTLIQSAGWFADCDPHLRTQVRVTLDGGQDPSLRSAAPEMLRWIREIKQDVFSCDSVSLTDHDELAGKRAVIDELWLGPPQHQATFLGTLVEWSLDALGWLAAFLAEASSRHGVSSPLMLTASQSESADSRVR